MRMLGVLIAGLVLVGCQTDEPAQEDWRDQKLDPVYTAQAMDEWCAGQDRANDLRCQCMHQRLRLDGLHGERLVALIYWWEYQRGTFPGAPDEDLDAEIWTAKDHCWSAY